MAQQQMQRGNPLQDYVTVAERIEKFHQVYPQGRIVTYIVEHDAERGFILMRAEGYRSPDDASPAATGHAFELRSEGYVNKTSYIENCESSCVGRMLAIMGFEVKRGLASREEMEKAARMTIKEIASSVVKERDKSSLSAQPSSPDSKLATDRQKEEILNLLESIKPDDRKAQHTLLVNLTGKQSRDELTEKEALSLIEKLKIEFQPASVADDPLI